jgi:hypothetical protein
VKSEKAVLPLAAPWVGLGLRERLIDEPAEGLQRLSAPDRRPLHDITRFRLSYHEAGGPSDACGRAVGEAALDSRRVPA